MRPAGRADQAVEALYAMAQKGNRNPLQFAVTMRSFRDDGSFPGIANFVFAVLAGVGKLLGYKPDCPYLYANSNRPKNR
jgi:hypothetical protein